MKRITNTAAVRFLPILVSIWTASPHAANSETLYYDSSGSSTVGLSTRNVHWSSSREGGTPLRPFKNGDYIYFSARGATTPATVKCSVAGIDAPGLTLSPSEKDFTQTFHRGIFALDSDPLNPGYCTIHVNNGASLNFDSVKLVDGPLQSPSATGLLLMSDGTATEIYSSRATNTYSGGTWVASGVQLVIEAASAIPKTGSLVLGSGSSASPVAIFRAANDAGYTCDNPVTIKGNVRLGNSASDAPLTFTGPVNLAGDYTLEVNAINVIFNSSISGTGRFNVGSMSGISRGGKVFLGSSNSYTGGTSIAFTLLEAASAGSLPGDVTLTATPGAGLQLDDSHVMSQNATLEINGSTGAGLVNLNFSGTQSIGALVIDGAKQASGIYGESASNPGGVFSGSGLISIAASVSNHSPRP